MDIEDHKNIVKLLKAVDALEEYKNFVTDICFDYKRQPEIGLMAIRVLSKGRLDEGAFREVWLKWRESMRVPVTKGEEI